MRKAGVTVFAVLMLAGCGGGGSGQPAAGEATSEAAMPSDSGTVAAPLPAASAGPERPAAFVQCASCHSVEPGKALIGPSLHGAFGSAAGSRPGYPYSPAMKASGLTWTRANLDKFLTAPRQMVPGTKMTFPGLADAAKRKEVIDYLEKLK